MSAEWAANQAINGESGAQLVRSKPVTGPSRRVLLVDDEPSVLKVTGVVLKASGHTITTASSGAEALQFVREKAEPFELLITDLHMPEMNGKELSIEFQKLVPEGRVIFMSGITASAAMERFGLDPVKDRFLPKPISVADLRAAIIELFQ